MLSLITALALAASNPEPANEIYYWDAPEVRALPDMAVWVRLSREVGWNETAVEIGRVWNGSTLQRQWFAQWRHLQLTGDEDTEWFEGSVPDRISAVKCPALAKVIERLQREVRAGKLKSDDPIGPYDGVVQNLTIFPDYEKEGDQELKYRARDDDSPSRLAVLVKDMTKGLKGCWPSKELKMYRVGKGMPKVKPIDMSGLPAVPLALPEPAPSK